MKKTVILTAVISFCLSCVFAQAQQEDFEEKHQDKGLIFLEHSETIKINEDWSYRKEEYKKVKILKEEARYMGEIPIPYNRKRDRIVQISAYVITPDGRRHRYTKIQDLSPYALYPVYSDLMLKIITMPEVNVGSVIEYKVVIESKGLPIKNAFWKEFYLTSSVPTKLLKTTVIFPKKLNIQYKEFNLTHKPRITQNYSTVTYAWEIQDAYNEQKEEYYTPPPEVEDICEGVEFSSIGSWSDISDWYYSLVQKNIKITPQIVEATQKAIEGKTDLKDKVRAILEYIQDNFRYVSMSFGTYSLEPHPTDEVFKNKYGDCKDLSLLCVAMLKVAGIESNIALFKDEFSITDPQHDLPMPSLFDHALVLVRDEKGGSFYIDPLLKGYDIGEYPLYYQHAYTFVITEDGGKFENLPIFPEERNYARKDISTVVNSDGSALSEINSLWDLDLSIETRDRLKGLNNTQKKDLFEEFDAMVACGGEVIERRWDNSDGRYGRITGHIKIRQRDAYLISDGLIILEVPGYQREIEFTKEERKNPIFFPGDNCEEAITTYHIPEGFRILSMPDNIEKDIGFFNVKRSFKREKNKIIIHETTRYKRLGIPKEDYAKVKEFFDKLPRDTYQRIVLKKTKSIWQEIKQLIIHRRKERERKGQVPRQSEKCPQKQASR